MAELTSNILDPSSKRRKLLKMLLQGAGEATGKEAIERRAGSGPAPVSFAQQRMWFLDQLQPGNPFYNLPGAVRLSGQLNRQAIKQAIAEIVNRHEVLRTTFPADEGLPRQVIAPSRELEMPLADLRDLPLDEREKLINQLAAEEAQRPFNLIDGPLLRVSLIQLDEEDHVFLLTMHHIVADGWSIGIFIQELASLYETFSKGKPSSLPALPIQYADYTLWQRERLQGKELDRQLDYWRKQLADLPVLDVPTDRPRPVIQSYEGSHHFFHIPAEVSGQLREMSQREGATLFMVLLSAFQLLLSRYSGQEDIAVGTAIAGRNRAETEHLIGCFVNTLVMRTDLSGAPTFKELVKRVREVCLRAYAHQDVPLEKLVEELQPERDLSRSPLFQTMFILQNTPRDTLQLSGLSLSGVHSQGITAKFDLLLSILEAEHGLVADLEYNTDLFDRETIERMCEHFQTLLIGIAADAQEPITRLPMLSESERERMLGEWNDTRVEYPAHLCVHELFEQQVAHSPDNVALVYQEETLTYRELNERANQLAHHLRTLGVGAEVLVGLCLPRSVEMVVALLGVLKAGGGYVPLDAEYPTERLSFMLEDAGVAVLITASELLEKLPVEHCPEVLCIDTAWPEINKQNTANVRSGVSSENLAYVIYTSGSTGQPKGVMIQHRSVGSMLTSLFSSLSLQSSDTWTLFHSYAFDFSVWELWGALLSGARLFIIPAWMTRAPQSLREAVLEHEVTVLSLTPSAMSQLLRASDGERWKDAEEWSLRRVVVGGEALSEELRAEVISRGVATWNFYGPTEATVWTTIEEMNESERGVSIGKPIGNAEIYILSGEIEPVGVGINGELYIGGAGLARAYLNRPELTAERFIPHPFGQEAGARLYRTGDVARYLPDGRIEYVGRADEQVKVRGYRIELGEIEAVLQRHPAVAECVVIVRGEETEKRLVAYMVATGEEQINVGEIREQLSERLPAYMVPTAYVILVEMPLTRNGKIDRQALPAPEEVEGDGEREQLRARTPVEELLVGIWREVLGVERVGIDDNFFELGGHSLLATQLISQVRDVFAVELLVRTLFERPTVAGLAERVEEALLAGHGLNAPLLVATTRDEELPLSFAQQRLWFLDQLEPDTSLFNWSTAMRLNGTLDIGALEQTFTEITRRHESLRTRFVSIDGQARQVIAAPSPFSVPVIDLSEMPHELRAAEAERLANAEAVLPFDLSAGDLLRVTVLKVAEDEHVVLLTMHHIISDGWSMGILIREVGALYAAYSEGRETPLRELEVQYGDYARWQRDWLQGDVLEQQLSYWREQLAELPVLEMPTDRPRPAVQSYRGRHQTFVLSREVSAQLREMSQREGATLFMVLLSAFQLLLSRYSGQEDIVVGTDIAGRNRAETENLIGFFINQLVLRTDLSGASTFRELVKRVREMCLGAYAHQDVPFEKLVEELQPERDAGRQPFFQVKFVLQNAVNEVLERPGLAFSQIFTESKTAKLDLLFLMAEGDELSGSVEYNTDLFDDATVERMIGQFKTLLQSIVAQPDAHLYELNSISDAEREKLMLKEQEMVEANKQKLRKVRRRGVKLSTTDDAPAPLVDSLLPLSLHSDTIGETDYEH